MDWISTPFVMLAFATFVVFAISCAFCFLLGRIMGEMDGRDRPGKGRRTGQRDRRGPSRIGSHHRGQGGTTTQSTESEQFPAIKQPTLG